MYNKFNILSSKKRKKSVAVEAAFSDFITSRKAMNLTKQTIQSYYDSCIGVLAVQFISKAGIARQTVERSDRYSAIETDKNRSQDCPKRQICCVQIMQ